MHHKSAAPSKMNIGYFRLVIKNGMAMIIAAAIFANHRYNTHETDAGRVIAISKIYD
jgi:hypothetical protein